MLSVVVYHIAEKEYKAPHETRCMAKDEMRMPMSTAGLVRYFDDSKSVLKIKPEHIVAVIVFLIAAEIAFKVLL